MQASESLKQGLGCARLRECGVAENSPSCAEVQTLLPQDVDKTFLKLCFLQFEGCFCPVAEEQWKWGSGLSAICSHLHRSTGGRVGISLKPLR